MNWRGPGGLHRCKDLLHFFVVSQARAGIWLLFNSLLIGSFRSSVSLTGSFTGDQETQQVNWTLTTQQINWTLTTRHKLIAVNQRI